MSLPVLRITGGPHGRSCRLFLDGVEQKGVVKFLVSGKSTDAVYLYTKQIVSLDIDMTIDTHTYDIAGEDSAVYLALKAVAGQTCGCTHPAHPGLVCGYPIQISAGMVSCECEG
jgi:uncharacterized protein (UPF0276 family)